jgi:hypothetical protein
MTALARASADAYSSYVSARACFEPASRWLLASTCRSKPSSHERATTLSETIISLSMVAHSWRRRR